MKVNNRYFLVILFITIFPACNMYKVDEILDIGKKIINENEKELITLYSFINCKKDFFKEYNVYRINTSYKTSYFVIAGYYFDINNNIIKEGKQLRFNEIDKQYFRNHLPQKNITNSIFMKNQFIAFTINKCRTHHDNSVKIIYFEDKNEFVKLFPKLNIYVKNQDEKIVDDSGWIYFYNDNWAITTSGIIANIDTNEF